MSSSVPAAAAGYFTTMNAEDWEGFAALWHPQARHMSVGAGWRSGRDEIVEFYRRLFRAWNEHDDSPTRFVVAGDVVTVEVRFTGTTLDGRELAFDAVDVIDLEDGLIKQLTSWYDIAWVRKQLEAGA